MLNLFSSHVQLNNYNKPYGLPNIRPYSPLIRPVIYVRYGPYLSQLKS